MELVVPSYMQSIGPYPTPVEWLEACGIAASTERPRQRSASAVALTQVAAREVGNGERVNGVVFVSGLHAPLAVVSGAVDLLCTKFIKSLVNRGRWMALRYWVLELSRRALRSRRESSSPHLNDPEHPTLAPPDVAWSSSTVTTISFQIPDMPDS